MPTFDPRRRPVLELEPLPLGEGLPGIDHRPPHAGLSMTAIYCQAIGAEARGLLARMKSRPIPSSRLPITPNRVHKAIHDLRAHWGRFRGIGGDQAARRQDIPFTVL